MPRRGTGVLDDHGYVDVLEELIEDNGTSTVEAYLRAGLTEADYGYMLGGYVIKVLDGSWEVYSGHDYEYLSSDDLVLAIMRRQVTNTLAPINPDNWIVQGEDVLRSVVEILLEVDDKIAQDLLEEEYDTADITGAPNRVYMPEPISQFDSAAANVFANAFAHGITYSDETPPTGWVGMAGSTGEPGIRVEYTSEEEESPLKEVADKYIDSELAELI